MPADREIFHALRYGGTLRISPESRSGGPVFDLTKLKWLNGEYLRALSLDEFFTAVRSTVFSDDYLRRIWALLQTRIEFLAQFGDLADFFFRDEVPAAAGSLSTQEARSEVRRWILPPSMLAVLEGCGWTAEAIDAVLRELGTEKQWTVKENYMLLRAILTGKTASSAVCLKAPLW